MNNSVQAANLSHCRIESNRKNRFGSENRIESKLFCPNWNALLAFSRNAIKRDCFELLHAFTRTLLRVSRYSGDAGIDAFDWQNAATFSTCDLDASTPTSSQSSEVMPCSFAALGSGSAARSNSMCQVNATHSYWLGLDVLHTRSARHSHDVKVKVKVNGV